jgi:hypothetical protein
MALSTAEIQQCKFWLGYSNLLASARPYFDIALVFEDVVQQNLDPTWGEGYVRNTILPNLMQIETTIQQQVLLQCQATELVGEVKIDAEYAFRSLTRVSEYWKDQLSMVLKIPRAPAPGGGTDEVVLT